MNRSRIQKVNPVIALLAVSFSCSLPTFAAAPLKGACLVNAGPARNQILHAVPDAQVAPDPKRRLEDIKEFHVGAWNMQDFFENTFPGVNYTGGGKRPPRPKSAKALAQIAAGIEKNKLDALVGVEVDKLETLQRFVKRNLKEKYIPYLIDGNDERGINVGFLLKSDLDVQAIEVTNKDEMWLNPVTRREETLFSRDLPALLIKRTHDPEEARPVMIILGTHNKSKRAGVIDRDGSTLRTAQAQRTSTIIQRYQRKYGKNIPIILAGDFNSFVNFAPEFNGFWRVNHMEDAMNLVRPVPPLKDRITHTFHPKGGHTQYSQLDGILVSPSLQDKVLAAKVHRYIDAQGRVEPLPRTYAEREKNPSDHYMVQMTLDLPKVLKAAEVPIERIDAKEAQRVAAGP